MNKQKNFSPIAMALILLLAAGCSGRKEDSIILRVSVDEPVLKKVGVVVDRTRNYTVDLDESGHGTVEIKGCTNIFPSIFYNSSKGAVCQMFLQGGDDVTLNITEKESRGQAVGPKKGGFSVTCNNSSSCHANSITDYLTNTPLSPFKEDYTLGLDDFIKSIEKCITDAEDLLEADERLSADKSFIKVEKKRITYAYWQFLLTYPMGRKMSEPEYEADNAFYDAVSRMYVEDKSLLWCTEYTDYMLYASRMLAQRESSEDQTLAGARFIGKNISDPVLKSRLEGIGAIDFLRYNGLKGSDEVLKVCRAYITDKETSEALDKEIERQNPLYPGHMSPEITATDINGKSYDIKSLRCGLPMYIDVWATWCGPCKQELPYMKELEEKYKGKISFVGISVDKDRDAWEERIGQGDMPGLQLHAGAEASFMESYGIQGIPRFILLDKYGRIIDPDAPRPSAKELIEKVLEELL